MATTTQTTAKESPREGGRSNIGTTPVPNAKQPKSRPPDSLRDKAGFLHGRLPKYSGPYSVRNRMLATLKEFTHRISGRNNGNRSASPNPRNISDITRHGYHILRLETVLMTIYYPSAFGSGAGRAPSGHNSWSRQTWLPRPRIQSARGYGKFANIGDLAVPLFAATTMFTKLPAFRNARLAQHWPPFENLRKGGIGVKNSAGPPPPGEPEKPCFPLVIFSHGKL